MATHASSLWKFPRLKGSCAGQVVCVCVCVSVVVGGVVGGGVVVKWWGGECLGGGVPSDTPVATVAPVTSISG